MQLHKSRMSRLMNAVTLSVCSLSIVTGVSLISAQNQNQPTPAEQITAIKQISRNIHQQQISMDSLPDWIQNTLNKGLNSNNPDIVIEAVRQIGNLQISSFSDDLIGMFKSRSKDQRIGAEIIRALGNIGSADIVPLLRTIISQHELTATTAEAILAVRKNCDPSLVSELEGYVKDLNDRILKDEFNTDKLSSKPEISPDNTLALAKGIIEQINSGFCNQK